MKEYKVYFDNRFITVSDEPDRLRKYSLFHKYINSTLLRDAVASFQSGSQPSLNIFGSDIDTLWDQFRSIFTMLYAAGGLVRNMKSEFLFIVRNGRWDLPKGHIEPGEKPEAGALREVSEECGISGQKVTRALPATWHSYSFDNQMFLKKTFWYAMSYEGEEAPSPQKGEGISEVHWLSAQEVSAIKEDILLSLRTILHKEILCP